MNGKRLPVFAAHTRLCVRPLTVLSSRYSEVESIAFSPSFDIISDMSSTPQRFPSIRALIALDHVARLGSVTRAADAMNTSQAAVSRHLRQIELELGTALVARSGRGIVLTTVGETYAREISEALSMLTRAGERVSSERNQLTIACTHEVSHLLLLPRYRAIKSALGREVHIRILTCEYTAVPAMIDAGADIVFEYSRSRPRQAAASIVSEEIVPAAAPAFIVSEKSRLGQSPATWRNIPRLSLTKANSGWATWEDWFAAEGVEVPDAPQFMFDNYIYALEAAARGEGIVLAWRGFSDHYIASGQLLPLRDRWLKCGSKLYAVLTPSGLSKQAANRCVRVLANKDRQTTTVKP